VLVTCLLAGFAELISSTLKMEAICSSETSVETQRTTQRHTPEDDTLQYYGYFNYLRSRSSGGITEDEDL
jgi:hypothetical protein